MVIDLIVPTKLRVGQTRASGHIWTDDSGVIVIDLLLRCNTADVS